MAAEANQEVPVPDRFFQKTGLCTGSVPPSDAQAGLGGGGGGPSAWGTCGESRGASGTCGIEAAG